MHLDILKCVTEINYLVVAVSTDEFNAIKNKKHIIMKRKNVKSVGYIDLVILRIIGSKRDGQVIKLMLLLWDQIGKVMKISKSEVCAICIYREQKEYLQRLKI